MSIPSSVSKISYGLFREWHSLEKVVIPSSATEVKSHAFFGCLSLKQVNIPSSIKSIGFLAFGRCESITRIVIPSSVTCIESHAFESSTSYIIKYFFSACVQKLYIIRENFSSFIYQMHQFIPFQLRLIFETSWCSIFKYFD